MKWALNGLSKIHEKRAKNGRFKASNAFNSNSISAVCTVQYSVYTDTF